jgi:DNA polymerase/3'-5' exonuclease PolX
MSEGFSMRYDDALDIAKLMHEQLVPLARVVDGEPRCKVVGSLRRRRHYVSDIELLIEAPLVETDLFGGTAPAVDPIKAVVERWGEKIKGGDKYIQVNVDGVDGLKCDVFIVTPPANWFVLLAIRTCPAQLGRECVTRMKFHGLRCEDGRILRPDNTEYPINSEEDFFMAARMPFFKALHRDSREALTPLPASQHARDLLKRACSE